MQQKRRMVGKAAASINTDKTALSALASWAAGGYALLRRGEHSLICVFGLLLGLFVLIFLTGEALLPH